MNICIDQGNTKTKVGLFHGDELVGVSTHANPCEDAVVAAAGGAESCIFSSVAAVDEGFTTRLRAVCGNLIVFSHLTPVPVINRYHTPRTLGLDRLAAAVGANGVCEGRPVLIIDAGTCVTYDFVTPAGEYLGGNIAPGLNMRLHALHEHTGRLPLVSADEAADLPELGCDTRTAILSGVVNGMVYEMEGYIDRLQRTNSALRVFFTGGDGKFFHNRVKFATFADDNLVLTGLNRILQFNARQR